MFKVPNLITIVRLCVLPVFVYFVLHIDQEGYRTVALVLYLAMAVGDVIDGVSARLLRQGSSVGKLLDPLADKLAVAAAFLLLSNPGLLPRLLTPAIPLYVTFVVILRDAVIAVGALFLVMSIGRFALRPSVLGKASTVAQMSTVMVYLIGKPHIPDWVLWGLGGMTVVLTALSGIEYLVAGNRAYSAAQSKQSEPASSEVMEL